MPVKRLPFPAFSISLSRQDSADNRSRQEKRPHPREQPFKRMVDGPQHSGFRVAVIPILIGAVQQEQEGEKCHNGRAEHNKEAVKNFPPAACYLCQLQIDHLQFFRNGSQLVCLGFRDGLSQSACRQAFPVLPTERSTGRNREPTAPVPIWKPSDVPRSALPQAPAGKVP